MPEARPPARFGTVRRRVHTPGTRQKLVFRMEILPSSQTPPCHRGGHRFSRNSAAAAPVQVDCGRRLNSLTAMAQPIYQHAHGPGTPVVDGRGQEPGVVAEGPVGARWAGRFRIFRYEMRRWRDGVVPDIGEAVDTPRLLSDDAA